MLKHADTDCRRLNPKVKYREYPSHLTPTDSLDIFEQYNLVLDCTDHPTSRYLISDACVLARKPLISASALKTDGQLMTLNMPPGSGPCYRCVFPKPPPAESVISCGEGGIVGPVVGVMGVLQAAKAIEMITMHASLRRDGQPHLAWQNCFSLSRLLICSAFDPQPFRPAITLKRRTNCAACSATPSITKESLRSESLDYSLFCGINRPVNILADRERITAEMYFSGPYGTGHEHILVDVREELHFDICHIPSSVNVPYSKIASRMRELAAGKSDGNADNLGINGVDSLSTTFRSIATTPPDLPIYFICRLGNDSQAAVRFVKQNYPELQNGIAGARYVGDIIGGLQAWSKVDPTFPDY
jgi:adenylyltransferase/sulfurtransferase